MMSGWTSSSAARQSSKTKRRPVDNLLLVPDVNPLHRPVEIVLAPELKTALLFAGRSKFHNLTGPRYEGVGLVLDI